MTESVEDKEEDALVVDGGNQVQRFLSAPLNCKLYVNKISQLKEQDSEYRKAEILSFRKASDGIEYYVHYIEFNKRLDEWVSAQRLDFSRPIEFPIKKKPEEVTHNNRKKKTSEMEEDTIPVFSKETEIEKLRIGGSMTQSAQEVARVKNLNKIQMGKHEVEAWYYSPYPIEYAYCDILYICEFCLSFYASHKQIERHRSRCLLHHPPGNEIYRNDGISFFEIDGRKQKSWCRNLCLLSKLFLDHKTLYYDVDPFLFYCMAERDEYGYHLIGYFSKEKESSENYNLACILTLPQYQRLGYGRLLIAFSYELSKVEKRTGSPEKPLSDLGLLSYRAFWTETIIEMLLESTEEVTIEEISQRTSITTQDILHTLQNIDALKYYRGQLIICLGDKVVEQWQKSDEKKRKRKRVIIPEKLDWKPIQFTPSQLRFL